MIKEHPSFGVGEARDARSTEKTYSHSLCLGVGCGWIYTEWVYTELGLHRVGLHHKVGQTRCDTDINLYKRKALRKTTFLKGKVERISSLGHALSPQRFGSL